MEKIIVNERYLLSALTGKILQGFYAVVADLVHGLSIDIYKRALVVELTNLGLNSEIDKVIKIHYKGVEVGNYAVDILVNKSVIVKIIAIDKITVEDERILTNQLKLSDIEVGLLLNFCLEGEHKRKVFTNDIKPRLHSEGSATKTEITDNQINTSSTNKKVKPK